MRVAALVGFWIALLTPNVGFGVASYVFFYQARGEWVVLCSQDEAARNKVCELSAPPPVLGVKQNIIYVETAGADGFRVRVEVRDVTVAGSAVQLQVDDGQLFEAMPAGGEAAWAGPDAATIVQAMQTGAAVTYTVLLAPDGAPRSTRVPLTEFGEALDLYRQVLQLHRLG